MFLFWHSKQFMYTTCSELVVFMYWTGKSMNNLLSYCGLVDARISASEKDLPVLSSLVSLIQTWWKQSSSFFRSFHYLRSRVWKRYSFLTHDGPILLNSLYSIKLSQYIWTIMEFFYLLALNESCCFLMRVQFEINFIALVRQQYF